MTKRELEIRLDRVSVILQAIVQMTTVADEYCGDVQASSNWLILIEAATQHAHFMLTGLHADSSGEMVMESNLG